MEETGFWEHEFVWKKDPYYGSVVSIDQAKSVIEEFEAVQYSGASGSSSDFGKFCLNKGMHCIRFFDETKVKHGSKIPTNGKASVITGLRLLECHQGPDHRLNSRASASAEASTANHDHRYKQAARKKRNTGSKKLGCSAAICLREVIKFPEYKPSKDTHFCRDACSLKLRRDLESPAYEEIQMEKVIYIDLPKTEDHSGHIVGDFAENHLSGLPCIFDQEDIRTKRKEVAATLLMYEVNVKDCCPACGFKPEPGEDLVRCGHCEHLFHRKSHCVGDDFATSELDVILCRRCNNNVE